jgi:hypothetical protein
MILTFQLPVFILSSSTVCDLGAYYIQQNNIGVAESRIQEIKGKIFPVLN